MISSRNREILVCILMIVVVVLLLLFLPVHTGETDGTVTDGSEVTDVPPESELLLKYDDRYSFAGFSGESCTIREIRTEEVTSYRIDGGTVTGGKDEEVLTQVSDTDVAASGTGSAVVTLDSRNGNTVSVSVTVEPAPLTLMFLTGQSNMEGASPEFDYGSAVLCGEGQIYSTYAPSSMYGNNIANINFPYTATADNAGDFVAESLTSDTARSGVELAYKLNSLSGSGQGKTGPDSGLAYEWNRLTGDKVWVVNTAWSSTSVTKWVPGAECYDRAEAVNEQALLTYRTEVDAGHYKEGDILMFWLQGEDDYVLSLTEYENYFIRMYNGFSDSCGLDAFGIISVRASTGTYTGPEDLAMSTPRIVQYCAGASRDYPDLYVVSNANEQWVTDEGTAAYFQAAYPDGITYETRSGETPDLPAREEDVHPEVHYMQIGHNENGITAADGMYEALYGRQKTPSGVIWRDAEGNVISRLSLPSRSVDGATVVPVAEPVYLAKEILYSVDGDTVTYDLMSGTVLYREAGFSSLKAVSGGTEIGSLRIATTGERDPAFVWDGENWRYYAGADEEDNEDETNEDEKAEKEDQPVYRLAEDISGEVYDTGEVTWWYIRDGVVDTSYSGPAGNEYGTWFVTNGKVDTTFTGYAEYEDGRLYVEDGQVLYREILDPESGTLTRADETAEEEPAEEEEPAGLSAGGEKINNG